MVILSDMDKKNIGNMLQTDHKYCSYPEGMPKEVVRAFMVTPLDGLKSNEAMEIPFFGDMGELASMPVPLGFVDHVGIHNLAVQIHDELTRKGWNNSLEVIKTIEESIEKFSNENKTGRVFRVEHLDSFHIRLTPVE